MGKRNCERVCSRGLPQLLAWAALPVTPESDAPRSGHLQGLTYTDRDVTRTYSAQVIALLSLKPPLHSRPCGLPSTVNKVRRH